MPANNLQQAKRSFVTVLLTIAALYSVRLTVTRDSSDEECAKAFKRVSLKAHPDKGGLLAHSQALNAAKETWDKARRNKTRQREGPKKRGSSDVIATQAQRQDKEKGLRVRSLGVLLTYSGVRDQAQWQRFVASRRRVQQQVAEGARGHPFVFLVECFAVAL